MTDTPVKRPRGRPRGRNLSAYRPLNVRLAPRQMAFIEAFAVEWKTTRSDVLRVLLDGLINAEEG